MKPNLKTHDLNAINLNKLIWFPLVTMVVSTLFLMSILVYRQLWSQQKEMGLFLSTDLQNEKNSIDAEVYLGQAPAVEMRLKSIAEFIHQTYPNAEACFRVTMQSPEGNSDKNITACVPATLNPDWTNPAITHKAVAFGGNQIGELSYFALFPLRLAQILPGNLVLSVFLSVLIALLMQKLLVRSLEREVVAPYLEAVRSGERLRTKYEIATQVAHDIRSPLSALDIVVSGLKSMPEEKRLLVRSAITRIRDIANNLLAVQLQASDSLPGNDASSTYLLIDAIEGIVTEKRLQYRSQLNVEIRFQPDMGSYSVFSRTRLADLKRVLSNLINNSVEALKSNAGLVEIRLFVLDQNAIIELTDNGIGIPQSIMPYLGNRQVSFGKSGRESGSGLGLYHAKQTLESMGGQLKISSEAGHGAQVQISLPLAPPPKWFVEKLVLQPNTNIVIVDDDASIHQVWDSRFRNLDLSASHIEVIHISNPDALDEWILRHSDQRNSRFLMDYEFIGWSFDGIDVIQKLGIGEHAILVTSRHEEQRIKDAIENQGIRLIPKSLAPYVPIEIDSPKQKPVAILIDNDPLVHLVWNYWAKENGAKVLTYTNPETFIREKDHFDRSTPIFVDLHLEEGVSGLVVASHIADSGFHHVAICTGDDPLSVKTPSQIERVVGKEPPTYLLGEKDF